LYSISLLAGSLAFATVENSVWATESIKAYDFYFLVSSDSIAS